MQKWALGELLSLVPLCSLECSCLACFTYQNRRTCSPATFFTTFFLNLAEIQMFTLGINFQERKQLRFLTHILQFVFLGNNGFRFPIAHFPTKEAKPASLYTNFWKAVGWLRMFGFQTNYCCNDVGEAYRSFIKMHFKGKDPVKERFTTTNPYTKNQWCFFLIPLQVTSTFNSSCP